MDDLSPTEQAKTWGIADLAREFGVTARALRFYEDKGLLTPVRAGQRRIFSARDRVRLQLILRGKRLGFSLDDIRDIIDMYDDDPTEVSQLELLLANIGRRRAQLQQQLADISETLAELDRLEAQSERLLAEKRGTPTP